MLRTYIQAVLRNIRVAVSACDVSACDVSACVGACVCIYVCM